MQGYVGLYRAMKCYLVWSWEQLHCILNNVKSLYDSYTSYPWGVVVLRLTARFIIRPISCVWYLLVETF